MDNKEICFRIATKLQSLGIPSHFKGYIYLFKCIYIVCETHIKGQLVDIEQIMKELALKYNISLSSLKYEINCVIELRMSHRNMQQLIELRSYYSRAGTGSVILNITHSLLDSLYWESQNKSDFYKLIICQ